MALAWLLLCVRCTIKQHTTQSALADIQKNNIQHCDGFVMASAQCQMYKKTIYNTVMALSWLLLSVRCTKKQHTTLWWLCRGFCSVSDVQKNNIHGFVTVMMALSWLCHGFCSVSDVQKNNIQHCDGFVMASAQCQMYKITTYNTAMALSWLLLSVRCTKKQYTTLWWLCRGFCSVSDVQKNNIQHCDGFVVASAQCQMYKKTIYNTVMALSWLLLSVRCTNNNIQHCDGFDGFVMASAQCQMQYHCDGFVMVLSVRCTKKRYTALWWLCHGFCSMSDV